MENFYFTNQNVMDWSTFQEFNTGGKDWLIVKGVALVEGVLNKFYVPLDEIGAFVHDWNDVPLVLNHPKDNSGSARVPTPDVPVIGRFHNATLDMDGRRLCGDFWIEKDMLISNEEGMKVYEKIKAGQPIELSTGYFAPNTVFENGKFGGHEYIGVHKGIHPDHIAILTNERGACSILDGCGMNRNSEKTCDCALCDKANCEKRIVANVTGTLPPEGKAIFEKVYKECRAKDDDEETAAKKAWGAVEKAGWQKGEGDKWMMKNAEDGEHDNSAMIALMIPQQLRADLQKAYPFMDDETRDSLHITLIYLGDSRTLDVEKTVRAMYSTASSTPAIKGKMQGLARFVGADEGKDAIVITLDSQDVLKLYESLCRGLEERNIPYHKEHGFIPHMTIGYVEKDSPIPVDTIEPMEINFSELSFVSGEQILPATLEGWGGGSPTYGNIQVTSNCMSSKKRKKKKMSIQNYYGPGPHPDGSPQSVHGGKGNLYRDTYTGFGMDDKTNAAAQTRGFLFDERENVYYTEPKQGTQTWGVGWDETGNHVYSTIAFKADEAQVDIWAGFGDDDGHDKVVFTKKISTRRKSDLGIVFDQAIRLEKKYVDYVDPKWWEGYTDPEWMKSIKNQQFAEEQFGLPAFANRMKETVMKNLTTLKAFLNSLGFKNVTIEAEGTEGFAVKLEGGDDTAVAGAMQLNAIVANAGGADKFAETFTTLSALPKIVQDMQAKLDAAMSLVAQNSAKLDMRKKTLVASLVANQACPIKDEVMLNAMPLDALEKLDQAFLPVDYSLYGGAFQNVSGADESETLLVPAAYLAPVGGAK
jgi:2'-5' RNA ligase